MVFHDSYVADIFGDEVGGHLRADEGTPREAGEGMRRPAVIAALLGEAIS